MDALVPSDIFLFDDFRLDRRGLFRREGPNKFVPVKIGSRALDVLRMLVERSGELVSKDELVAAVWSGIVVEDSNLTVQISILRRVLDGAAAGSSCIQTVAGRGYRFVAPVAHGPNGADSVVNIPIASERTGHRRSSRPWHLWLAGLAAVAAMALVAFFGWDHRWFSESGAPRLSIVVLPFADLSNDPGQEYFADAVTGDLTTDLSRIKDSFVIAHTTAVTYKGKPLDVKQISRDLGVRYVLEGSVQRLGERIQVNVQLLDGGSGSHVWADRFDTDRRDLAEAQSEITGRLARTLNTELTRDAGHRIEEEHAADPDARDLVMRARALWMQGYSAEINKKVLDLSERALAIDRGSVDARIAVGRTLAAGIGDSFSNDVEKDQARAEQLLLEALDRDPNRSSAHEAMGLLRRVQGRWAESQAEFERAIALDRNDPWAMRQLGMTVLIQGKPESAIPYLENSIRLDPYAPNLFIAYLHLGNAYLFLGHTDQAIELLRKAEVANPSIWYVHLALAGALGLRGDVDEARREIAEVLKLKPDANSFARLRAIGATTGIGSPQFRGFREKTVNVGLRRAGFPEE
jgi:adenylate cyclase